MSLKPLIVLFVILFSVQTTLSAKEFVSYREYGAVGDGISDDFDAIVKTHDAANKAGLKVRADAGAAYYIGGANKTAVIQTGTDWGDAKFIIDDRKVENRSRHLFSVTSKLPSTKITTVKTLKKNQKKIADWTLPSDSFVIAADKTTIRYIRYGVNQNDGAAQTDAFVVDKNGNVDMKGSIIWDFDNISSMTAYPIDSEPLTVRGGHFTTIANQTNLASYYSRGISISRSNVVIDGVYHAITDEPEFHAPYGGFISISNCAGVMVQNCKLSGHKTAYTTSRGGDKPWSTGTYDVTVTRAVNVTFKNCKQINDIHDRTRWGIFGSNYSKNITLDNTEFSRFDAHMGVTNATIKNSTLGHAGINLIGFGVCLVENTKVCAGSFINLRADYGSTFDGEVVIRNCEFLPRNGERADAVLFNGSYSGQHDFGYTCYMPRKITIDGLVISDVNHPNNYPGPKIFATFNSAYKNEEYIEKYPYQITKEVEIKNLTIKSGKPYIISSNPFMFRNVKINEK